MKRRIAGAVACGVILIAVGVVTGASRATRRYDFQISGPLPTGVQVVPVSIASQKPILDLNLFGKQIIYPKPDIIVGFDDPEHTTSGFVSSLHRTYKSFCEGTWTDEQGVQHWSNRDWENSLTRFLPLPTAFGDKPRELTFQWNDGGRGGTKPFKITLPPSGRPVPELKAVSVKVGDVVVRLDPEPPIAPGFHVTFNVTIDGGLKGVDYRIQVGPRDLTGASSVMLRSGQLGRLYLSKSLSNVFIVEVFRLASRRIQLVTQRRLLYRGILIEIKEGEKVVAHGVEEPGNGWLSRVSLTASPRVLSMRVGDAWFGECLEPIARRTSVRDDVKPSMKAIKTGQRFTATEWKFVEVNRAEVKIPIPSLTFRSLPKDP